MFTTFRRIAVLVAGLATLAGVTGSTAFSQTPSGSPRPTMQNAANLPLAGLREQEKILFSLPAPVVMQTNARCDQRGNIYLVYGDNVRDKTPALPIRRLSPDSRSVLEFALPQIPEYQSVHRLDWDVTPWGTVYALLSCHRSSLQPRELPDFLIVRFKDDGSVDSVTKVEQPKEGSIWLEHFAVFAHGGFLITGTMTKDPAHPESPRPFTGVYRENGQLLREVELPDFVKIAAASVQPGGETAQESTGQNALLQASWAAMTGEMVAGLDDNLYSLRATSPAVLYKISPDGAVVKEVRFQFDSSGLTPVEFSLPAQGGGFVVFGRSSSGNPIEDAKYHTILALVDLETGAVTRAFRMPGEGRVMSCGCVTAQGQFLFPGATDTGKLALVKYASR